MYQELPETDSCLFGNLLGIGVRPPALRRKMVKHKPVEWGTPMLDHSMKEICLLFMQ
jgi:hypothetical protein